VFRLVGKAPSLARKGNANCVPSVCTKSAEGTTPRSPVRFVTLRHKAVTYELRLVHRSLNVRFSYVIVHVRNSFQSNEIFFSFIRVSFSLMENNNLYCVKFVQTRLKFYSQICYLRKVPYSVTESEIMKIFGSVSEPLHKIMDQRRYISA